MLLQVELEIMLPEEMSVKESHDIALMLQHKVPLCMPTLVIMIPLLAACDLACFCPHS